MDPTLAELINALLAIIPLCAAPRAVICLIMMNTDPDQAQLYKVRLINVIKFVIIAEVCIGVLYIILYDYLNPPPLIMDK